MQEPWEPCPPAKRLKAYAEKRLDGKYNEWTYRHLKFCDQCLDTITRFKRVPGPEEIISGPSPFRRFTDWIKGIFK